MRRGWLLSSGNDGNWEGEEGGEKRFLSSPAFSLAPQNNIQESGLSTLLSLPKGLMVLSRPRKIVGQ